MKILAAITLVLASSMFAQTPSSAPQKHPFTFEDMMKLKRVGAPVPSPDGKWVVFDCEDVDLAANKKTSHLWIVPASGGESRRLNPTPNHEERPRFSADGKRLIWTSKATDPTQVWMCDFDPETGQLVGQPHQVTSISTGADGAIWSPDGKNIVFVSSVYPDCKDDACNKQRDEELKKSKVKAKIFHAIVLSALERVHGIQTQPFVCNSSRRNCRGRRVACSVSRIAADTAATTEEFERAARPHAGRSRRAAVLVRRSGHVRDFAGRPGGRVHEQHRRSRSNQHEQRNFHRADQRWHAEENFHQSWQRHHAALFTGRKISRLALASTRRIRSR